MTFQYNLSVKPDFAERHPRERVIGSPIRESLDDETILVGKVIDWIDREGYIDLIIEVEDES